MAQAWGNITAFGTNPPTINDGSSKNFTITRLGQGIYLIDFDKGLFSAAPGLVLSQQYSNSSKWTDFSNSGGSTLDNVTIIALDEQHAKVKTGDSTGAAQDRNFSFIALGQPGG